MKNTILKSTVLVLSFSLLSKGLGFLREMVIAAYFGADRTVDAFNIANGFVSNILYMITAALAVALLPKYILKLTNEGREATSSFTDLVISDLMALSLVITGAICILARPLAALMSPGYEAQQVAQVASYLQIFAIGIICKLLADLFSNILNAEKQFGYSALTGAIYSVLTILLVVLLQERFGILALVISVPLSYLAQVLFLSSRCRKFYRFHFHVGLTPDIKALLVLSVPVLLSNSLVEFNEFVDRYLATTLATGSVSCIGYANALSRLLNNILIGSVGTVMFTEYAEYHARGEMEKLKRSLLRSIEIVETLLVPCVVVFFCFSQQIVSFIYQRGAFGAEAVSMTALRLQFNAVTILVTPICFFTVKVFSSIGKTKVLSTVSIITICTNMLFSITLKRPFGFSGIAAGTLIAEYVSAMVSLWFAKREFGPFFRAIDWQEWGKIALSALVMGLLLTILRNIPIYYGRYLWLIATAISIIVYCICLLLCHYQPLYKLLERFSNDR